MNFKQLGISNDLVNTLNQMGIKNPTPIHLYPLFFPNTKVFAV